MIQLPIAQEWVRHAEAFWWNPEEILPRIRLSEHVSKIISVLETAADAGDSDRVWMEIERVRAKYITMERFEAGVAQQKCARIALEIRSGF